MGIVLAILGGVYLFGVVFIVLKGHGTTEDALTWPYILATRPQSF